jgi:hypothetical protein
MAEKCAICGCDIHRSGDYAEPTIKGRSHATKHHYVPERFFGRSKNRPGTQRNSILPQCPWDLESETAVFCYECHEELLHNPVFLPGDIKCLSELVKLRHLSETQKTLSRETIAGRLKLLHDIITKGIQELLVAERKTKGVNKAGSDGTSL